MSALKHEPATPLPWKVSSDAKLRILGSTPTGRPQLAGTGHCVNDALYIAHAANAYPKLVEALREYHAIDTGTTVAERQELEERVDTLLRDLGEEA